jgi:hemoglobin-like flavoprotein
VDLRSVDLLKTSFALLAPRAEELAGRFYGELFLQHPSLRPLFPKGSGAQQRHVLAALSLVIRHIDHLAPLRRGRRAMSRSSDDDRPTPTHVVAHVLVDTMRRMTGPEWTAEHAEAWTVALTPVAGVVLGGGGGRGAQQLDREVA